MIVQVPLRKGVLRVWRWLKDWRCRFVCRFSVVQTLINLCYFVYSLDICRSLWYILPDLGCILWYSYLQWRRYILDKCISFFCLFLFYMFCFYALYYGVHVYYSNIVFCILLWVYDLHQSDISSIRPSSIGHNFKELLKFLKIIFDSKCGNGEDSNSWC